MNFVWVKKKKEIVKIKIIKNGLEIEGLENVIYKNLQTDLPPVFG